MASRRKMGPDEVMSEARRLLMGSSVVRQVANAASTKLASTAEQRYHCGPAETATSIFSNNNDLASFKVNRLHGAKTSHLSVELEKSDEPASSMVALRQPQADTCKNAAHMSELAEVEQQQQLKLTNIKSSNQSTARRPIMEWRLSSLTPTWCLSLVALRREQLLLGRNYIAIMIIILIGGNFIRASGAVDCFKCSSRNGSNPACEDPFHNLNTTRITSPVLPDPQPNVIYHTPCYAGKKGKEGLFPASVCIKLTGTFDATGETMVVRHCALDSGTLTQDTELARMSHCGKFQFEGDLLKGCVLACPEDACNSATGMGLSTSIMSAAVVLSVWIVLQLVHHQHLTC